MTRLLRPSALSIAVLAGLAACTNASSDYGPAAASNPPFVEGTMGPPDMSAPSGIPTDPVEDRNDSGGQGDAGGSSAGGGSSF